MKLNSAIIYTTFGEKDSWKWTAYRKSGADIQEIGSACNPKYVSGSSGVRVNEEFDADDPERLRHKFWLALVRDGGVDVAIALKSKDLELYNKCLQDVPKRAEESPPIAIDLASYLYGKGFASNNIFSDELSKGYAESIFSILEAPTKPDGQPKNRSRSSKKSGFETNGASVGGDGDSLGQGS